MRRAAPATMPRGRVPSVRPLLHPSETSRLTLAMLAALILTGGVVVIAVAEDGASVLLGLTVAIMVIGASVWAGQQIYRARLLGRSVKVTQQTLPAFQRLIDEVRATLHYQQRVDIYVIDKASAPITTTSYLGTRIIVVEGGLVAELLEPSKRPQLTFLIGRSIGALRAKHTRLDIVVVALEVLDALRYASLFILPWYRATTYSGDQIGMMCCADLNAALEATRRLLVGKELAAEMSAGDILPQVRLVKGRLLPRLAQLFLAEPHITNRYANLLCFGRYHDPQLCEQLRASMDAEASGLLEELWQYSPHRRRMVRIVR